MTTTRDGTTGPVGRADEPSEFGLAPPAVLDRREGVNGLTPCTPSRRERFRAAVRDLAAGPTRDGCDVVSGGAPA